jgi:hypothetical protein
MNLRKDSLYQLDFQGGNAFFGKSPAGDVSMDAEWKRGKRGGFRIKSERREKIEIRFLSRIGRQNFQQVRLF